MMLPGGDGGNDEPASTAVTLAGNFPEEHEMGRRPDADTGVAGSPGLYRRPDIDLERPGLGRLTVEEGVALDDPPDIKHPVLARVGIGKALADLVAVDGTVDHDMTDVDALGAIFL